jgi:hypothetical protein
VKAGLSAAQIRNRLRLSARRITADHWPAADGLCPVCRTPACQALWTAITYLDLVGDDYLPVKLPLR